MPCTGAGGLDGQRLGHRPGLDGVRGLAVLLVIAAHVDLPLLIGGGASGVTLFLVLSGFLITRLLDDERSTFGDISFAAFYKRRALRLFPALALVIVVWSFVDAALGEPWLFDAAVVTVYMGNVFRSAGVDIGSLSHTWSLALEEQFYLAWPAVLAFRRPRWQHLLVLVVLLWGWRYWLTTWASVPRVEFGPDTRADALVLGCALALAPIRLSRRWVLPLLLATVPVTLLCESSPWTTGVPVASVWAAALVVAAVDGESVLTWRPVAAVGVVAYGLYLWHIPIDWLLERDHGLSLPIRGVLVIALSVTAAVLSWRLVERPVLALKARFRAIRMAPDPAPVPTASS